MPATNLLSEIGLDKYERNARLKPSLLLLTPVLATLLFIVWPEFGQPSSVIAFVFAIGLPFFASQIVRRRGQALECKWGDRIGREHSARLLNPADDTLSTHQKGRVITFLDRHGPASVNRSAAAYSGEKGLSLRRADVRWLLAVTRNDADESLLLNENINYGFWRNMRAIRTPAILVALAMPCLSPIMLATDPPAIDLAGFAAITVVSVLSAVSWFIFVTDAAVENASLVFAERLFDQIDNPAVCRNIEANVLT
jgi:hypothetical protein